MCRNQVARITFLTLFYAITVAIVLLGFSSTSTGADEFSDFRFAVLLLMLPLMLKYLLQLSVAPFYHWIDSRRRRIQPDASSLVTVMVPAWNEEVGVVKTLRSVLENDYPSLELIVINDGSTDGTDEVIKQFIGSYQSPEGYDREIRYLSLENGGKAKAMNEGLLYAQGEYVVTVDADSVMDKCAVSKLISRFTDPNVGAVAGNVIVANRARPIGVLQQLEYLYGFFFKRADALFNSVYIIGGAAAAYRKDLLLQLNGFDHKTITEDIEMSTRILGHGYKTRYAADAVVYTEGPSDLKGLCNQRLRWKFGRFQTFFKHRHLFFSRDPKHSIYLTFLLLPLAVYAELLLILEGPLLLGFFAYSFYYSDFMPLLFMILLTTFVISFQVLSDPKLRFHTNLLVMAPIAWVVFYIIDFVEFQALLRSAKRFMKREGLEWQKWVRVGVLTTDIPSSETIVSAEK